MISDKQRRGAVDELRRAAAGEYRHVDALDVVAGAVGVDIDGKYLHDAEETVYGALADLIDRPTCHDVGNGDYFVCSECECELTVVDYYCDSTIQVCGVAEDPKYCPHCGAEVMGRC